MNNYELNLYLLCQKKNPQVLLKQTSDLASLRYHTILTKNYNNMNSELIIFCHRHQKKHATTFRKYKRTKWGCPCCAQASWKKPRSLKTREKISKSLKNKPKNYRSWLLGKTGPNHPSYKHGKGNVRATGLELKLLKQWKQQILHSYNYKCFLTGVTNTKKTPLVCHHLESWDVNPKLRFDLNNGVIIQKKLHWLFHQDYGFGKNTKNQFEMFCQTRFNIHSFPWKHGDQEPNLITIQHPQQAFNFKKMQEKKLEHLVLKRNHKVLQAKYEHAHSEIHVYCSMHQQTYKTTYHKYKKAKFGMPCCAKKKTKFDNDSK